MNKLAFSLAPCILILAGCGAEHAVKPLAKENASVAQTSISKRIPVAGFDPEGEPEIRVMSDGTLAVAFNFMPPSYAEDQENEFADFDKQLEKAIGLPVEWEDRELLKIRKPANDTADKIRVFLEGYRDGQK